MPGMPTIFDQWQGQSARGKGKGYIYLSRSRESLAQNKNVVERREAEGFDMLGIVRLFVVLQFKVSWT